MLTYWQLHKFPILMVLGSMAFYYIFGYQLVREDFIRLITLVAALFFFLFKLMQLERWNFTFLLVAGITFRALFLFSTPNLSQDFYRFIWDGQLILNGVNPYLFTPNELLSQLDASFPNKELLHQSMGSLSAKHYSNYPPLNQLLFTVAAFLGFGSIKGGIVSLRLLIIMADVGVLWFGKKILQQNNLSPHLIFWYFLNPLIIIELTGNLHFEGVMFFLFITSIYLLQKQQPIFAGLIYAMAILLKLVPLLFLPLFLPFLGLKKSAVFYASIAVSCVLLFLPFYTEDFAANYSKTIALWFSNFEFNASIYNAAEYVATTYFDAKPWLFIKTYGKIIPLLTIGIALGLLIFKRMKSIGGLLTGMLILMTGYYFITSTVHPWYLVFPIGLCLFTTYRFPLLWSATVFLSYYTYSQPDFKEYLPLLVVEYILVFGYMTYEILKNRNKTFHFR